MLEEDDDISDEFQHYHNVEIQSEDDDSDEDPDYVPENLNVVEEQMTEYIRDIESALSAPSQISKRRKTNKRTRENYSRTPLKENDETVSKVLSKETDSRIYERF
uniref:Uncharacterized protein n=1 Tax=Cacopsylla melanoneura TaxID=428564 RepID=A0A8D8QBX2_9HEMI